MPKIKSSQLTPDEQGWITVPYATGWADYDAVEWMGGRYMKDSLGFVHMKGLVKNNTGSSKAGNDTIFTLPVGYRPSFKLRFITNAGGAGNSAVQIDVWTDGTVKTTSAVPASEWVSISPLVFKAEQ